MFSLYSKMNSCLLKSLENEKALNQRDYILGDSLKEMALKSEISGVEEKLKEIEEIKETNESDTEAECER